MYVSDFYTNIVVTVHLLFDILVSVCLCEKNFSSQNERNVIKTFCGIDFNNFKALCGIHKFN